MVHDMYCNTRFRFVVSDNSLVNMMAIHTLAAIFRQQGRVDVYYPVRESIEQILWHKEQKTCKDQIVDLALAKEVEDCISFHKVATAEVSGFDTQICSTRSHISIFLIIYNDINHDIVASCKIFSYLLSVGTIA